MVGKRVIDIGDMAVALTIWLCTLPFIGLLVIPLWGLRTAALVALIALIIAMVVCWGICGWKLFTQK